MDLAQLSRFGFLTLPGYSMIAVTNAIEACRMANRCVGAESYASSVLSLDGAPVAASNGLSLTPTRPLDPAAAGLDLLFVCGGIDVREAVGRKLLTTLRRIARTGVKLGALCTGAFVLAEAGLLDEHRCAVHWEDLATIREEFPDVTFVNEMFVVDRDRLTCTGGTGPLDMMLALIEARFGRLTAEHVSAGFVVERIRAGSERQPVTENDRVTADQPLLARAVALIEQQVNDKRPMADIADELGVSLRQLQRQFRRHLKESPGNFAKELRLKRAQTMLRQMDLKVTEVALACGFTSSAYFSSAYRTYFGHSPRAERGPRLHA